MPDFLLELLSEEIPARMQGKACADLARLFEAELGKAGLAAEAIETYATPRRLALIARGVPAETAAVRDETKGPRTSAPPQALEGFLRKTGLTREQLEERDGTLFAVVDRPGRAAAAVLAEAVPAIVRAFPWPKSMRWGAASTSTESLRWVRPLHGIVALLGEEIVDFEIAGIRSGAATVGHRFHHPGAITIGSTGDYVEKLRACHVVLDAQERRRIIAEGAAAAARDAGLELVGDEGLLDENAGLTEWPVPLLGSFDPAFLDVPREVIQLTMRTNQKYFACVAPPRDGEGDHPAKPDGGGGSAPGTPPPPPLASGERSPSPSRGGLAPAFVCVANIEAADGGAAIVEGNRKVLAARLADARFFWEQDLKVPLEEQAQKLSQIVFHEKLGTVADKVERVAKLARWLVEEGIISSPGRGGGPPPKAVVEGAPRPAQSPLHQPAAGPPPRPGEDLAALAERAARLCKADLVTQMVGEFPELQGVIGGHLARAQGEPAEIADAIRDHYKPVGQGDEVPTAPVTVAVSLADKLDSLFQFFLIDERPTGSKDPYALRRAALGAVALMVENGLRTRLSWLFEFLTDQENSYLGDGTWAQRWGVDRDKLAAEHSWLSEEPDDFAEGYLFGTTTKVAEDGVVQFLADRLKVQQREAGVRHDLIDAVFAAKNQDGAGEDDLVRLLARVRALQAFVETPEGADLLAGYKRAANILRKEGWGRESGGGPDSEAPESVRPERSRGAPAQASEQRPSTSLGTNEASPTTRAVPGSRPAATPQPHGSGPAAAPQPPGSDPAAARQASGSITSPSTAKGQSENKKLSYTPEKEEAALIAALDSAAPRAAAAVEAEDFEGAMAALASLRAPVDAFFDKVTVNDADPAKRRARLDLLARMRDAVHRVADFSKIEG